MLINRATLQGAFDVLEYLQGRGFKCVIAGGCARDLFFGVKPKDVDIIVVCSTMATLKDVLEEATIAFSMFYKYDDETDDRIIGGFKLNDANIDVILYNCLETSEAIQQFDYNINQFVLIDVPYGIDIAKARFVGTDHWCNLVPVRRDASIDRQAKMEAKFRALQPLMATMSPEVTEAPVGGTNGPL